jgi:hypothetical protein
VWYTLAAYQECFDGYADSDPITGSIYDSITIAYPPDFLSTQNPCQYHGGPLAINYTELYYPQPNSLAITGSGCDAGPMDFNPTASNLQGSPGLVLPSDIIALQPAWSSCSILEVYPPQDPPYVLTKQASFDIPSAGTPATAYPEILTSAQPLSSLLPTTGLGGFPSTVQPTMFKPNTADPWPRSTVVQAHSSSVVADSPPSSTVEHGTAPPPISTIDQGADPPPTSTVKPESQQFQGTPSISIVLEESSISANDLVTIDGTPVLISSGVFITGSQTDILPTGLTTILLPVSNSVDGPASVAIFIGESAVSSYEVFTTIYGPPVLGDADSSTVETSSLALKSDLSPFPIPTEIEMGTITVSANSPAITVSGVVISLGASGLEVGSSDAPLTASVECIGGLIFSALGGQIPALKNTAPTEMTSNNRLFTGIATPEGSGFAVNTTVVPLQLFTGDSSKMRNVLWLMSCSMMLMTIIRERMIR